MSNSSLLTYKTTTYCIRIIMTARVTMMHNHKTSMPANCRPGFETWPKQFAQSVHNSKKNVPQRIPSISIRLPIVAHRCRIFSNDLMSQHNTTLSRRDNQLPRGKNTLARRNTILSRRNSLLSRRDNILLLRGKIDGVENDNTGCETNISKPASE